MTTQWVLDGECHNFPLMYHARVVERASKVTSKTTEIEREEEVAYWDGSDAIRRRVAAADEAPAEVVICMEQMSESLYSSLAFGKKSDLTHLEKELFLVTSFMRAKGFLHFDTHFGNLLTSGRHVYFSDFGLAISQDFDLTSEERAFLEKHRDYDRMYVASELACAAIQMSIQPSVSERAFKHYLSAESLALTLPPPQDAVARRYRRLAYIMEGFKQELRECSKSTPYPEALIAREVIKITPK